MKFTESSYLQIARGELECLSPLNPLLLRVRILQDQGQYKAGSPPVAWDLLEMLFGTKMYITMPGGMEAAEVPRLQWSEQWDQPSHLRPRAGGAAQERNQPSRIESNTRSEQSEPQQFPPNQSEQPIPRSAQCRLFWVFIFLRK